MLFAGLGFSGGSAAACVVLTHRWGWAELVLLLQRGNLEGVVFIQAGMMYPSSSFSLVNCGEGNLLQGGCLEAAPGKTWEQHACRDEASRQPVALSLCHGVLSLAQSRAVLAARCSAQGRGAQPGLSARSSEAWRARLRARGWGAWFFSQLLSSQGTPLVFLCLLFPES